MAKEVTKIKKKKWVQIQAPKLFKDQYIGEICVTESDLVLGRIVKTSLMEFTGDMKRQSTEVGFRIIKVENNIASTEVISYRVAPASIKRLMRRSKEKIDQSFTFNTSDGKQLLIKPLYITINDTKKSQLTSLRKASVKFFEQAIPKMKYDQFIEELISGKLQNDLRAKLSKIYPLKICFIRHMQCVKDVPVSQEVQQQEVPKEVETSAQASS